MRRVGDRQLELAFAANPEKGREHDESSGVPEGKAWLRRIARAKVSKRPTAGAADTGRLLEEIASGPILAEALLNVAANKGAAGVDGKSVEEVVSNARSLLPKLRHALLVGSYRPVPGATRWPSASRG
jgi:retron-type reverse transcriptase